MNIVLIAHFFGTGDGQGRVNYETARAALNSGFAVTMLAETCAEDLACDPNARVIILPKSALPTRLLKNISFAVRSSQWLKRNRKDIGLIQANGFVTFAPVDIVAVHFVHGAWMRNPLASLNRRRFRLFAVYQFIYTRVNSVLEQMVFKRAKRIVAVSKKVAQELVSIGVPKTRISVIFNGVDVEEFRPRLVSRSSFSLPDNGVLFLFSGDIRTHRKNIDGVLRAIARVEDVFLTIAGKTEGSPYPALARELKIEQRVFFLGYVANMNGLMNAVDGFIFPSRYDPMGLVVLEAMASGLPVITAMTTGAAAALDDQAWTLDDPDDVPALADMIRTLAGDSNLRSRLGERNRQKALNHSWAAMASSYIDLYRKEFKPE
jgi:glycosyltransferase involved in cell wall biosynthesis